MSPAPASACSTLQDSSFMVRGHVVTVRVCLRALLTLAQLPLMSPYTSRKGCSLTSTASSFCAASSFSAFVCSTAAVPVELVAFAVGAAAATASVHAASAMQHATMATLRHVV